MREAIYDDIPWLRRRRLHRRLAESSRARGGDTAEVADHWLAARDPARALDALLEAIAGGRPSTPTATPRGLGRRALDLWPEGESGAADRRARGHARHAELAGDLTEAARAQREVVAARRAEGAGRALADAERRIASIYALQGDRPRALAARRVAAEAYAANGLPGEAAAERLVIGRLPPVGGPHAEAARRRALARARGGAGRAGRPARARDGPGGRGARRSAARSRTGSRRSARACRSRSSTS